MIFIRAGNRKVFLRFSSLYQTHYTQIATPIITVQSLGVSKLTARFNPKYNTCNPDVCVRVPYVCVTTNIFQIPYSPNGLCPLRGTNVSIYYVDLF